MTYLCADGGKTEPWHCLWPTGISRNRSFEASADVLIIYGSKSAPGQVRLFDKLQILKKSSSVYWNHTRPFRIWCLNLTNNPSYVDLWGLRDPTSSHATLSSDETPAYRSNWSILLQGTHSSFGIQLFRRQLIVAQSSKHPCFWICPVEKERCCDTYGCVTASTYF